MKYVKEQEALEMYDHYLDYVYGNAKITWMEYTASRALKRVDPIAYRYGFEEWLGAEELEISKD